MSSTTKGQSKFLLASAGAGFLFLYAPIIALIIYSFNASKLVTVWGGWSFKWYVALFQNEQIMNAAWVSLKIAFISATLAAVLGTMAGFVLSRMGRFKGKTLLAGWVTAPLVMPEVITGLSLLLLFVAMESLFGWPAGRGMTTIIIAHTTFCLAYVAVVVQSRLASLDATLEEAAMDLGAKPSSLFFLITLPLISPAIVSGWLLSFTLSLDDLVIASFVSGPGNSTLPMVIFSKVRLGVTPEVNALATLMIVAVTIAVLAAVIIMRRQNKVEMPQN
ncbi:ABC transporter permease subunit [Marinomonas mediterranea]|jgi:ABC-type spermidine/putrescine transport system, permease component II|uniref:ABC-type transporter, integral membrane subunit n=1 Tax=Marinomonas mediterranea (strain ATCC 700492 / JCM 21426 / NBRC 103028 / MMB-1) TaxID=717774 RepID=F2JWX4_MARM1|nr:ABC transporter permease subunit [Marinomonas mediterranea]ADZ92991.1 ABC-type transporter, integral membrane subunit [Marinomonas mediterranea MMB-1]WCN10904.1 ABC transporter permease subunit [Marinomonas mediterranea]WCN14965.1 ABC transporter permease subunit [Marinomonas mediterranea]WCN19010.1 ABC transporter permease subunit [Marinomonas mediterranea MMB-1]